jgi:hypothetical protein
MVQRHICIRELQVGEVVAVVGEAGEVQQLLPPHNQAQVPAQLAPAEEVVVAVAVEEEEEEEEEGGELPKIKSRSVRQTRFHS